MSGRSFRGKQVDSFASPVINRVSLVVPCYNVVKYIGDFIASVLEQDWPDLEVILVNDGASDGTTEALRAAVEPLRENGWTVTLIEQENRGLAGAVDAGLKHVTGEFLMWPDPDDWLLPDSIARRVQLMRENPDIGLLRSNCRLFNEERQAFTGLLMPSGIEARRVPELFEDLVFQRFFYAPVCHMVRSAMFWQVHPEREIWFSRASSQNFQLLVPFVERFPVLQVPDVLACYRVREDSRSRASTKTHDKLMGRHEQLYEVTVNTLPKLRTNTPERASRLMNQHWRNKMLPTAIRAKMKDKGLDLIARANLTAWRKAVARICMSMRCSPALDMIDAHSGRILSRGLARTLDAVVRMPEREAVWGSGPLWAEPAADRKPAP